MSESVAPAVLASGFSRGLTTSGTAAARGSRRSAASGSEDRPASCATGEAAPRRFPPLRIVAPLGRGGEPEGRLALDAEAVLVNESAARDASLDLLVGNLFLPHCRTRPAPAPDGHGRGTVP